MAKRTGAEIKDLTELEQLKFYGYDETVKDAVATLLEATSSTGLDPEMVAEHLRGILSSGKDQNGEGEDWINESDTFVGLAVMERLLEMMPKSNEVWVLVDDLVEVVCGVGVQDVEEVENWVRDVTSKSGTTVIIEGGWIRMDSVAASTLHDEEEDVNYSDVFKQVRDLPTQSFATLLGELPGYVPPRAHRGVDVHVVERTFSLDDLPDIVGMLPKDLD